MSYWRGESIQAFWVALAFSAALVGGTANSIAVAQDASASAGKQASAVRGAATYGFPEVAYINEMIRRGWADHGITPAAPSTDSEWCRRVYLDILGRIPSVAELDRFSRERGANRRLNLVNRLLGEGVSKDAEEQKLNEATKMLQTVKVTLLASLNGYAPALAVEFGRKVLYSTERPSFSELEAHVKQSKSR